MKRSSRRRKKNKFYSKILIIFIAIIIVSVTIKNTRARYSSNGKSNAKVDVAYYLLNDKTISENINLPEMEPGDTPYEFTFSVANNDGTRRTETAIIYTISIRMTTNLPLRYKLFINGGTENMFETSEISYDGDMPFKTLTSSNNEFGISEDQVNTYKLEVEFPAEYKVVDYQGIIELLEIKINAQQKV